MPPPTPHLAVQLRHRIGALALDVNFALDKPWTILFGPSGSGKSTILRAIAGLLRPDLARIVANLASGTPHEVSTTLTDTANRIFLPAYRRGIPLAAQTPHLFPHLTVRQNVLYGLPSSKLVSPKQMAEQLEKIAGLFRIAPLLSRYPRELSGGEAQRVSLARAASARSKRLLLLDEPFTGLDMPLRDELIADLLAWQAATGTPILSVTHDIAEAFQLGAEVIKLSAGRIVQQGPAAEVLAEERARLLAQLAGNKPTDLSS